MSIRINLLPVFTVFASLKHSCFQTGERARRTLPVAPGGLAAKISAFHPGYPGPVPAQGIRSLLRTAYCCLSEIITKCNPQLSSPVGADTKFRENSYPIHRDIGPVMDATGWRREGCRVVVVFRECCSVQHKSKVLVREGCKKKTSLSQFILGELGHLPSE